jgi:hypothetical protein
MPVLLTASPRPTYTLSVTLKKRTKEQWYAASYLLLLVPVAEVAFILWNDIRDTSEHILPAWFPWFYVGAWGVSGLAGLICAIIGGGGFNKKRIDGTGSLALMFHVFSIGALMMVWFSAGCP